jgi:polyribonucleotide nucleotidyltransferase
MQKHVYTAKVGESELIIETGTLAKLAGGAVTVRSGDSVILATACGAKPREGVDFFPLSVDYEERLYAAGRIPGSFQRREGRPSDQAILISRLVDRPLRPLFPKGMMNEVQVIVTALARDPEVHLDTMSIIGASAAMTISNIPWEGPIGAVRVGFIDGQIVINPTVTQMASSTLDLRMAGTADAILMVEAGADELPEDMMLEALKLGHEAMQPIIELQNKMRAELGKPKFEFTPVLSDQAVEAAAAAWLGDRVRNAIAQNPGKEAQYKALADAKAALLAALGETYDTKALAHAFESIEKSVVRARILGEKIRPDGRSYQEIRPITVEVGILPRVHGTGLFTRGETQVLTVATLGTPGDTQKLDTLNAEETKRYMHHYNFPAFSTGEVSMSRGPKRREIGHGALAERALEPMIPAQESFPYTLRLVSEAL